MGTLNNIYNILEDDNGLFVCSECEILITDIIAIKGEFIDITFDDERHTSDRAYSYFCKSCYYDNRITYFGYEEDNIYDDLLNIIKHNESHTKEV